MTDWLDWIAQSIERVLYWVIDVVQALLQTVQLIFIDLFCFVLDSFFWLLISTASLIPSFGIDPASFYTLLPEWVWQVITALALPQLSMILLGLYPVKIMILMARGWLKIGHVS